ncbi:lyase family protein [Spirochaeta dissipatitropha]
MQDIYDTTSIENRVNKDSLGEVIVPADALWGPQTQRAVNNFDFSGYTMPESLRRSLGLVKAAAAASNLGLGLLGSEAAQAIESAGLRIWEGAYAEAFPVEVFQTGSGTSWNMNCNEVIAGIAAREQGITLHPNDQVNLGQSSNDVIPTAINIACLSELPGLYREVESLAAALLQKADQFDPIVKLGRTHLQDAVPVRLGDAFRAAARQFKQSLVAVKHCETALSVLALGGTAAGSGLNTHPRFAAGAAEYISGKIGTVVQASDVPAAEMNSRLPQVFLMGALQGLSVSLQRWAIDLRLLSSGPNGGFGEINLPELQPGSSIMPGKINPVIPEAVQQISVFIMAKSASVNSAASQGPLELNIMFPLIAYETIESLRLLKNACKGLNLRCVAGITANADNCREQVESSLALITKIAAEIGYDRAAKIALKAQREKRTLRDVLCKDEGVSVEECDRMLDPESMI